MHNGATSVSQSKPRALLHGDGMLMVNTCAMLISLREAPLPDAVQTWETWQGLLRTSRKRALTAEPCLGFLKKPTEMSASKGPLTHGVTKVNKSARNDQVSHYL